MNNNYLSFTYISKEGKLKQLGLNNEIKGVVRKNEKFYVLFFGVPYLVKYNLISLLELFIGVNEKDIKNLWNEYKHYDTGITLP